MLLSVLQCLDKAVEYEKFAKDATKPKRQNHYANLADFYRWLAQEAAKVEAAGRLRSPDKKKPRRDNWTHETSESAVRHHASASRRQSRSLGDRG
jgi:methyltransferase-like protein